MKELTGFGKWWRGLIIGILILAVNFIVLVPLRIFGFIVEELPILNILIGILVIILLPLSTSWVIIKLYG